MKKPPAIDTEAKIAPAGFAVAPLIWLGCAIVFFIVMFMRFHREDYTSFDSFNYYYPLMVRVCEGLSETQHPMIPPLLPWSQGLFMRLTGLHDPARAAHWFNLGLLLPMNLLVAWGLLRRLARPVTRRWPALLLGFAFILLNPLIIWRSLTTGSEMLYSFCWSALLLFFLRYLDRRDILSWLLLALLAGLCALVRPEGFIWLCALSCATLCLHRLSAVACQRLALMWLVVSLVCLPRLVFMQQTTGMPILDIRMVGILHKFSGWNEKFNKPVMAYMGTVTPPPRSAMIAALEKAVYYKPAPNQNLMWRFTCSLRGVTITLGPMGLFYLLLLRPSLRRKVAAAWQGRRLILLHGALMLQFLAVTLSLWFEERYGSSMIVVLALTGGIVFSTVVECLSVSRKNLAHLLLAGVMVAWSMLVMWKIPTHRLEKAVANALRDRVPPGAVIMSLLPTIPYYLQARWCPVPDWQLGRVRIDSDQLVKICQQAGVDVVIYGDVPMWRHAEWWSRDAKAHNLAARFRMSLGPPTEVGSWPLVLDARRMRADLESTTQPREQP